MRLFHYGKDGGEESTVWGFFFIEIKSLFTIVLLRFEGESRDAYHEHAFNCISWLIKGCLLEQHLHEDGATVYESQELPFITRRSDFHRVTSQGRSWVLSIRGPWSKTWREWTPAGGQVTLKDGRNKV